MIIGDNLRELGDLPTFDFQAGQHADLPEPETVAWRLSVASYPEGGGGEWEDLFGDFAEAVDTTRVRALVIGSWKDMYDSGPDEMMAALLAAREQLPDLRSLFVGDVTSEECEISWITQEDLSPLLDGFPRLERFGARGGNGLLLPVKRHEKLRSLTVESGGLAAATVRGIAAADLPALEHLDLWLGTSEYGGDSEIADLQPFFTGTRLPALRSLALRNSERQDEIAAAMAAAPVVARLDVLDLSMGVLSDDGAAALLGGQPLTHLKKLDLHYNFLTGAVADRLREALEPAGVELDLDPHDAQEDADDEDGTDWRFVAVGE
jgi:hypothetical protein